MAMQKLTFHWEIQNFVNCDRTGAEFFDSPRFFISDSTLRSDWILRLFPADNVALQLLRLDSGATLYTKHSISFLNRNGRQIETESRSELCIPSKFTAYHVFASNYAEFKKSAKSYMDGGVLSVLCEIDIYEKNEEIEAAVPEKLSQMRGTSWVIQGKQRPIGLNLIGDTKIEFYIPHGNLTLCLSSHITQNWLYMQIIDEKHLEIKTVPITILLEGNKKKFFITRSDGKTVTCNTLSFKIYTRCMVKSIPDASPMDITPCVRKIQKDFRNIFSQSEGGDISIAVDGKLLHVHKNILSGRCPVFAAMFNHEWCEKNTQIVNIKEFDYKTILALIEFIYFGGREDDHGEEAADPVELLKAAHMYQLDDLKNKCEQRLCECLENENVADYIGLAVTYDLPNLKKNAFSFIKAQDY